MSSFYNIDELNALGIKSLGTNVLISKRCSIFSPELIKIGSNVRIDDFCILSGTIELGDFVHISAFCALYGSKGIKMENYTGLSPRCTVFSATDDFSGDFFISPMVPQQFTNVTGGEVIIKRFSQIGSGSIIMPNLIIEEGVAVGAMSFVNVNLGAWTIYAGIPVVKKKARKKGLLKFSK